MRYYKYYGENQFNCDMAFQKKGLSIRFSNISEFNDPFEGRLNLTDEIKPHYDYMRSSPDLSNKKEQIKEFEISDLKRIQTKITKEINKKIGVYCLTTEPNNKLMWSHYADSHKGFCIEFDFNSEIPCELPNRILKVKYQDHKMKYIRPPHSLDYIESILSTKDLIWKYENEYRALANIINSPNKVTFIDTKNIRRIIFGLNCRQINIDNVRKWIHEHKAHHIILSKISLSHSSFDIYIEDL